ncbi:Putative bacilysin exporter BacE [Luteitalea pratensis]|uniref:Bacilysin exporter BacE n=1 Tax=Luteitalea pratensis TaxID=1855912 RepID=A0A143PVG7_LUTPR|nr:MFS transporter [Luteitalea pratensis]AMY12747.1 Putative bacilysin exporter BacE [Luteitalea pratensis]
MTFTALLLHNPQFRRLWIAQVVSQLGDWFNAVAVYALLLDLTGSATLVAAMMVVQLLPLALVGPLAGVIVDRMSRRTLMIGADLARAVLFAGLVFVRSADQIWLAFVLVTLGVIATAFFEPARTAMLPDVVPRESLITANALSAATWAVMLAIGASVGGAITVLVGRDAAFICNGLSFLASAAALRGLHVVETHHHQHRLEGTRLRVRDGIDYLRQHPATLALLSIKGVWAVAGGMMLLLTVFGQRVFATSPGETAARGIGVLFAARGVGAVGGALLARAVQRMDAPRLRGLVPWCYGLASLGYLSLANAPTLAIGAMSVVWAHVFGTLLWVLSSVLLQLAVEARIRGRIFALELALHTFMSAAAILLTGIGLDRLHIPPRTLATGLGAFFLFPAVAWGVALTMKRR